MVFGHKGAQEDIERTRAIDMAGMKIEDVPPASADIIKMLTETQQLLEDRSAPFHERMKDALDKMDEAAEAFPESPHVLIFRGSLRYQNLDLHLALSDLEKLQELLPDVKVVLPLFARVVLEMGDFEHAGEIIDEILKDKADNANALTLKAELCEKLNKSSEAAELLARMLPGLKLRDSVAIRNTIAKLLLEREDLEGALDILQPLIDESIQNSETYRLHGDVNSEMERPDDARDAYRTALTLDPGNMKAHYNLALVLRDLGQREKAYTELDIVSSTIPNDADAHYQLFEIGLEKDDRETAIKHALEFLMNAEEIEDDDPVLAFINESENEFGPEECLLYGKYLIESGDAEQAVELLTPMADDPDVSPPFEVLLASAMIDLDRVDEALVWTEKALDHYEEDYEGCIVCSHPHPPDETDGGEFAELICQEAGLHISKGQFDKALEALEELGEDDSLAHTALRVRGEVAFLKEDYGAALEHFHNAIYEHPADVDSLASLAAAYRKMGNTEAALNYYLRAHVNDHEDIPILRSLIELYIETGRKRQAKVFIGKYGALEEEDEGLVWAERELLKLG